MDLPEKAPTKQVCTRPGFWEAFRYWLKLGFINFGGPAGQIALMHTDLVERKRWISERRFLHALNYCMLLPGPEAQQLAIYVGWLLHGVWGGIVAGTFFFLPSAVIIWALSYMMVVYGQVGWVAALFYGLQVATIAVVAEAVQRIGRRALKNRLMWGIAAASFVAIFFLKVNFVFIVLASLLAGVIAERQHPGLFSTQKGGGHGKSGEKNQEDCTDDIDAIDNSRALPSRTWLLKVSALCLVLWWSPVILAGWLLGWKSVIYQEGLFFGKAALITFGGAYSVLPYVAQTAVEHYHWLSPSQMMSGLALAESTPGPLIMVLQIVGFIGAWNQPGDMSPLLAATLGAAITTWTTFLPSFYFIFAGAPYIERMREVTMLNAGLSAITAAVVGVVLNLGVWFSLHMIFPGNGRADWPAALFAAGLFLAMHRYKWDIMPVLGVGAIMGLTRYLLFVA
ncbi:MAG: chromate efflux transporter [Candidatus Methylacidiphilales bacterium]|nr:chromate efflux transporter [Candidatus Methylacidiphilales bacterium]